MSLYNMIFGQNAGSDALLALLGLKRSDVGRFRNAFLTDAREIAIYTRNGGGNRECWHTDGHGSCGCKGTSAEVEVDEYTRSGFIQRTGRRVIETQYTCDEPSSASCACPGCVATHRLPAHACYLRDEDDDYDCTYATFFFKVPDEHRDEVDAMETVDWKPSQRWLDAIDALGRTP